MRRVLWGLPMTCLAVGCATMSEDLRVKMVSDRASFDLSCNSVTVQKLSDTSYGVVGCSKKASYVLDDCGDQMGPSVCKVDLDAVQQPDGTLTSTESSRPGSQK